MKHRLGAAFGVFALLVPPVASAADPIEIDIDEWRVPYENSRPRDPAVAPDGRIWFVGQAGDYVGWFDPETAAFGRHPLPKGTGPHNVVVGDDGTLWYTGNLAHHIGRMDPATGAIARIEMPDARARDPHTLVFDEGGDLWFTLQGANQVGYLDVDTRAVRLIDVPTPNARPYGIIVDDDGRPWLNLLGSNKLATVDPANYELTEITTPRADARTRRIAVTAAGIWYVDWAQGRLGRSDPHDGTFEEWLLPGGVESRPYAMATDAAGRVWVFETGGVPNRLVGFDPDSESFFAIGVIPSGGGSVRHAVYDSATDTIWFGTDRNTLGRARLP